jgi:hypothetical protein
MLTMLSAFRAKDRLLKSWPELQMRIMQLAREGSPPPGLRQNEKSAQTRVVSKASTRDVPIVIPGAGDPAATGLVASLARPGGRERSSLGFGTGPIATKSRNLLH